MTTRLEFTFNDEKELADFLARLQNSAPKGAAPETKAKEEVEPVISVPNATPKPTAVEAMTGSEFIAEVTKLKADNPSISSEVIRKLLIDSGYQKLSLVPQEAREGFMQKIKALVDAR